jgi:large subunit ribosomal protein L6
MSRIGRSPISVPSNVTIAVDSEFITVNGPKGSLKQFTMEGIQVVQEGDSYVVKRDSEDRYVRSKHGLMRTLVNNMVIGVSEGFTKKLEINGVGYRAAVEGSKLKLTVGFSHPVNYEIPQGITIAVEQNIITVSGISKQQVGQVAAEIRAIKKPEPYKGKGIKYTTERVIRKSGKSGKDKTA